jgi:hypothetical protein
MKESKEQTTLNAYLRKARFYCYGELKVMRGNTFNFANIEEGQKEGLPALEQNGLVWKFSDEDRREKMCDFQCTPPLPAYLVIKKQKTFYFMRYELIQKMKSEGRVSIKLQECKDLAEKLIHT